MKVIRIALGLLAAIAVASGSEATTMEAIEIYSTGVTSPGVPAAGGSVDTHWTLDDGVGNDDAIVATQLAGGYPANDANSQWIGPDANLDQGFGTGLYVYTTTFDLSGLDYLGAMLSGRWVTDDRGEIWLNGVYTGITNSGNYWDHFEDFAINSGFTAGLNTLEMRVYNDGGPAGARMEVSGLAPAPEPSTALLLAGGLLGLRLIRRRRSE